MSETVAVFGGSFDPPHASHVLLAAYVLSHTPVDRVLVVPTWQHALDKHAGAPFEDRLRMCELAFADLARLDISDVERELGGTSFTLRTLTALRERLPDATLRLVIGADILAETHRWHRFEDVKALAPLLIVGRAGHPLPEEAYPILLPEVSSTGIRDRIAEGRGVDGMVPTRVAAFIAERGLYRSTS